MFSQQGSEFYIKHPVIYSQIKSQLVGGLGLGHFTHFAGNFLYGYIRTFINLTNNHVFKRNQIYFSK